jgi:glycosyltransferase involved in cell wall biosynthesis
VSAKGQRVLLTTDAVGGVWTYTLDLAAGLQAAGMRVRIAVLGPALKPDQRNELSRAFEIVETGLSLEWLAASRSEVTGAADALAALARAWGADLLHLHSPALATAMRSPCPVIVSHHSCVATWWAAVRGGALPEDFRWRAALIGEGLRRADLVLVPSAAHGRAVAEVYGLPRPPQIVHNGRAAVTSGDMPAQLDEIFTAGRLWDEGKDIAALDRAAASLAWPVRAAGEIAGPDGTRFQAEHIDLLGRQSQAEIRQRLAGRPIYASPARFEPFGLAVLEAAQAGCALVLSDIATFRELWDGAALFAAAADAPALAAAVRELMEDPDRRRELGHAAQTRAEVYTLEAMVTGTLAAYQRCFASARIAVPAA